MRFPTFRLGLISALPQEQAGLLDHMRDVQISNLGMRDYVAGKLWDADCVCVLSRIGKVAAAATVATLIERFKVTHIVFTGVAGAADPVVKVGDIVVARDLIQHDMDASPLFPRFEVPLTGLSRFASDQMLSDKLLRAADEFIAQDLQSEIDADHRNAFRLDEPHVHHGLIASGDVFVDNRAKLVELKNALPDLLAVEMEGAAVAQVCYEFGVPCAVIRTISDGADEDAPVDFLKFIDKVAAPYAFKIIERLCSTR